MVRDSLIDASSDWDDELTLDYLREVAPDRLDAMLDAADELTDERLVSAAWDEAGHVIAAALCGVRMEPFVFTLLPDADPRERAFIWWAGPYARKRSQCRDPFIMNTADLHAADDAFYRFETEEEMARQLNLAWPHVRELAARLSDYKAQGLRRPTSERRPTR